MNSWEMRNAAGWKLPTPGTGVGQRCFQSALTRCSSASSVAPGDEISLVKPCLPIMLRSGKCTAILKRMCNASTRLPLTRIS